jgi:hypothetical protein
MSVSNVVQLHPSAASLGSASSGVPLADGSLKELGASREVSSGHHAASAKAGVSVDGDDASYGILAGRRSAQTDRFDPSELAKIFGAIQLGDTSNIEPEALLALQHVAEQAVYGQSLHPALLQRDLQAILVAVQTGNAAAAKQALSRLRSSIESTADVVTRKAE